MKINELRIGNWILSAGQFEKEKYIQVDAIFFRSFFAGRRVEYILFDEEINPAYKPIPITNEWLNRLNFNLGSSVGIKTLTKEDRFDAIYCEQAYLDVWSVTIVSRHTKFTVSYIKYVHELQNLYFVLIGKELKTKTDEEINPSHPNA